MSNLTRRSFTTAAAASGWVGGEISLGEKFFELESLEISVPDTVDYALPCYVEWVYHEGKDDEDRHMIGVGTTKYRQAFVLKGPLLLDGSGKLMSAVYHHSTLHTHTIKARYREVSVNVRGTPITR